MFNLSYFIDKSHFDDDYLIFNQFKSIWKTLTGTNKFFGWKFKEFSEECIKTFPTSDNSFAPKLIHIYNGRIRVKF